jgi:ATP-dependent helicase/nuclease subunit A
MSSWASESWPTCESWLNKLAASTEAVFSVTDFISQLSQFVARQPDEALAATHSENTDVVRLMSIHQAKGLEFPIVVVPDLDRPRNSPSGGIHFDPSLGPLVRLPLAADGSTATAGYELWSILENEEDEAELDRLLYVAITRAADLLILSSSFAKPCQAVGPWTRLLARRFELASGKFVGGLPLDEPRPQVKVIREEPVAAGTGLPRRARVDVEKLVAEVIARASAAPAGSLPIDPILPDTDARRQYSFSRLAGKLYSPREDAESAAGQGEGSNDALELGTLVHGVLAAMDFVRPGDCRALVQLHAQRRLPAGSPLEAEAVALVERFMQSARARQLATAVQSHAEVEFLLAWPSGAPARDMILNGFIDHLYQDAARDWHVLDFKTNKVGQSLAEQAAPYEMQMLVYALASEQILGAAPKSLTLHFLRNSAEYQFAWNEAARRRVVELVNQGIATAREIQAQ